jgi:hypothetical protein
MPPAFSHRISVPSASIAEDGRASTGRPLSDQRRAAAPIREQIDFGGDRKLLFHAGQPIYIHRQVEVRRSIESLRLCIHSQPGDTVDVFAEDARLDACFDEARLRHHGHERG